jgi:cyclic AMP-dependent transcription factor ATF-2
LTPTPTRLLNKCEELRVFEDPYIQNINPFDEGFRNATEHRDSLSAPKCTNQDTLHTPQIIPDFIARAIKDERVHVALPMQDEPENLSTTPDVVPNIPKITVNASELMPLLPKPAPSLVYAAPLITAASRPNESVKDRLKNIILSNSSSGSSLAESSKRVKLDTGTKLNLPAILIQTVPLIAPVSHVVSNSNSNSGGKLKIADVKPVLAVNYDDDDHDDDGGDHSTKKRTSGKSDSSALKVERNRAAARRYRNKMKLQGQALREKYDKSQKEIGQLKKDITELKKLLLLHKDCEVTKRLNRAN